MKKLIYLAIIILSLTSCIDEDEYEDTAQGNFEALWKIMDEHYCFFDYKDVNWNDIYNICSTTIFRPSCST